MIIADDITGAADSAVAFARQSLSAMVTWGGNGEATAMQIAVHAYDADSRGLSADAAAERHAQILTRLLRPDRMLLKKIDSTLRGQPAAETAATVAYLQARDGHCFGVLAPAFPANNRSTVEGRVLVNGRPLEETEAWRREHTYANADLVAMLASANVIAENVPLSVVRGANLRAALDTIAAKGNRIAICDAETEDDLRLIARSSCEVETLNLLVGSAGLAHALAAIGSIPYAELPAVSSSRSGILIVVGSLATASRRAAESLIATATVSHYRVADDLLFGGDNRAQRDLASRVADELTAGRDVLVDMPDDAGSNGLDGRQRVDSLAALLAPVASAIGALAATGGETVAALLTGFGVYGIRLIDEIAPGMPLGVTAGALTIPVATKAGAFGADGSLIQIVTRLRAIRTEGSMT